MNLFPPPVPEASPIYGFTFPIAEELESSIFKNLGNSHTTRTAIIASIKSISMEVSLLYFPISLSFISFCQLTQPQIAKNPGLEDQAFYDPKKGIETLIFMITTGLSVYFNLCIE